jgi:iron complex transport system ATP-binding protein
MENERVKLRTENLCFAYPKGETVICDLNVSVADGKITALIGANGCGKSTLFNLLTGGLKPQSGAVFLDGSELSRFKRQDLAKRISAVYQQNTAPDDLTVRKLGGLGRVPYQKAFAFRQRDEDAAAVAQALQFTDTQTLAGRPLSKLSGGQKQRAWFAMALAQTTDTLLLDEFTSHLDIRYQLDMLHLTRRLNEQKGVTVLLILHDVNQALTFCDEIIVMKQGRLLAQGTAGQIVTADLLREAYDVDVRVKTADGQKYCIFYKGEQNYGV